MTEKKPTSPNPDGGTKVGPPVDDRPDDGRKHDDGTAGPRPQGAVQGEPVEELKSRHEWLQGNPIEAQADANKGDSKKK